MNSVQANVVRSEARSARLTGKRGESGFTLVEVMVVILIIGILLAVGIPTFLGARNRAHDAAAQSSLNTALETGLATILSDIGADLTDADVASLAEAEPSLRFLPANQASTGPDEVSVDSSSADRWVATVRSQSGTCFGAEVTQSGTSTYTSNSCSAGLAADLSTPVNVAPMSAASMSSDWPSGSYGVEKLTDGSLTNFAHSGWSGGQSAEFDLGSITTITELRLWNRVDCCPGRMKNMWIFVSDTPISTNLSAARASGAASFNLPGEVGSPSTIGINTAGQYVRVFSGGPVLHLAEIEIMALP